MSSDRELREFVRRTHAEVRDRASPTDSGDADFRENAFAGWVLEFFEEAGVTSGGDVSHFEGRMGPGVAKVNGYAIGDDEDKLSLVVAIHNDTEEAVTVPPMDISRAAGQAARFLDGALGSLSNVIEASATHAEMVRRIAALTGRLRSATIHVVTDGISSAKEVRPLEVKGVPVRFEVWDAERLFRVMQAGRPRDEIEIDFSEICGAPVPCLPAAYHEGNYEAYVAIIPGEALAKLYDEYGAQLLEFNVRSFLSARGRINAGIRKTLREQPLRFLAYNNGIVATADSIVLEKLSDGRPAIRSVRGLQIVNGGQTTASIHRAWKTDRADVSRVMVQVKLAVIDAGHEEEVVHEISRCANTQNVVQMADFSANDPFQVALEGLSRRVWCPGEQGRWFYERARGQYQEEKAKAATPARQRRFTEQTPPARRFVKTDVARYHNTWELKPHTVCFGSQKNFDFFAQDLRTRKGDFIPDEIWYRELIAMAILYRSAESIVREGKLPAYRTQMATYLAALLVDRSGSRLDLDGIWKRQGLTTELFSLMRSWVLPVLAVMTESAAGRNVTEWCKKRECWDAVRQVAVPMPSALPAEFSIGLATTIGEATETNGSVKQGDRNSTEAVISRQISSPAENVTVGDHDSSGADMAMHAGFGAAPCAPRDHDSSGADVAIQPHGHRVHLGSDVRTVSTAKEAMLLVLRYLGAKDPDFWRRLSVRAVGRSRNHLTSRREAVYPGRADLDNHILEIVPGWFLGTNLSNPEKSHIIRLACEVAGPELSAGVRCDLSKRKA